MAHFTARLAVAAATLWLACSAGVAAQARERVAFVSVVDRKTGAPLEELTPRDIVIREDRVAREVLRMSPATGPMPLAIVVDNSAAAEPAIADIRNALTAFVSTLARNLKHVWRVVEGCHYATGIGQQFRQHTAAAAQLNDMRNRAHLELWLQLGQHYFCCAARAPAKAGVMDARQIRVVETHAER